LHNPIQLSKDMTMTRSIRSNHPTAVFMPVSARGAKPLSATLPRSLIVLAVATAVITLAALGACSTVPRENARLNDARTSMSAAMANPQSGNLPGGEVKAARDALAAAEAAQSRGDDVATVDHLSYLALQRSAIVQESANRKSAEMAVTQANAARDKLRLEARTQEANTAQRQAAVAQNNAQASQADAEAAQRAARDAQRGTVAAQQQSALSQQQAMDAERRAADLRTELAAQTAALAALDAKKTERGMVITMGDVLFDTGRAELKSGGVRNVEKLSSFLKAYPQRKVLIEGYTDSVGGDEMNQSLSSRRADAVRAALLSQGVGSDRLATRGYGEAFPVAGNDNASGRQLNRRVEIVLSDEKGAITPR